MAKYCDSAVLESNWFHWLLSSRVPTLEKYRGLGLLWTKVNGVSCRDGEPIIKDGKTLPDPSYPLRSHCIALASPIYFDSDEGKIDSLLLPPDDILNLDSDSPFHNFNNPLSQQTIVIPSLIENGYIKEISTKITWSRMFIDIQKICHGIAIKFKQKTEEDRNELTSEALLQVINKIINYKLVYKPGMAPVFNLLTTTIYRVMYSIMNKRKNQREGLNKIIEEASCGKTQHCRSLRVNQPLSRVR